jgi:peptide/nickel transport system permease protein
MALLDARSPGERQTGELTKTKARKPLAVVQPKERALGKIVQPTPSREFVEACHTLGMRDRQIIFREILPNALPPVIVYASVVMAVAILLEAALAFLRLSDPNVASWGNLIGLGRDVLRVQWYVSAIPGVAILITVLAVSLVGQGLNDALNPRLKGRGGPT